MFRIDRSRVVVTDIDELRANVGEVTPLGDAATAAVPHAVQEAAAEIAEFARAQANVIIEDAKREADAMLQSAREQLQQAELDSEKILAEAKTLGYELGYNEGRAKGESELAAQSIEARTSLSRVMAELDRGRQEMLDELEGDIIDLCFAVVRKIISLDRAADGELFRGVIKKALGQLDLSGKLTLRLSAEDCERFFPDGEAVFDVGEVKVTMPVAEDALLEPGDVTIESEDETLLAGAQTQLRKIELSFNHLIGRSDE